MHLVRQELKKIVKSKMVWISCSIIILVQITSILAENNEFRIECGGNIAAYNSYADAYNDTLVESLVSENVINEYDDNENLDGTTSLVKYGIETCFEREYYKALLRNRELNIKGRTIRYWNNKGINALVQTLFGIISGVAILVGLIFAAFSLLFKDKENEMDRIIYSSYIGRKEIISAKALAMLLYTMVWITIYFWCISAVTIFIYGNIKSLKAPIYCVACLSRTSYNMSTMGFLTMGYAMFMVSGTFFAMCFLLVFTLAKNAAVAFGGSIALIFITLIMPKNGRVAMRISTWTPLYTYTHLLLDGGDGVPTVGEKLSGLYLEFAMLILSAVIVYILIKKLFWSGRIER